MKRLLVPVLALALSSCSTIGSIRYDFASGGFSDKVQAVANACAARMQIPALGAIHGKVEVVKYVAVDDCGNQVNPLIVEGQVHGGILQGAAQALFEEAVYDEAGNLVTSTLTDYLVPSACEIPAMQVVHLESASPTTLGGFRGMGEGGTIGAPAAIANALSDALSPLGIEIDELPATPERLYRLIEAARHQAKR